MHQLFVTEVYHSKIKFDLKSLKEEFYQIQKIDKSGRVWSKKNYPQGYTSYGSMDRLDLLSSTFSDLKTELNRHVYKYAKQLSFDVKPKALTLNSMWINVMGKGAQHTAHIHPHSVISGTFYVDIPADASAIRFEDPRLGLFMNTPVLKAKAPVRQQRFVSLQPKAGDVVLFESWLKHEVPRNLSAKPRLSISFNYGW